MIHLGGEAAVIVPLNEYKRMRQDAGFHRSRRRSGDVIRQTAEEFIESAQLPEADTQRLLTKLAAARAAHEGR